MCIFCEIAKGGIASEKVYEDDKVLCFKDINPAAPVHLLVIPKEHISAASELSSDHSELMGHLFVTASTIAAEHCKGGFRLVVNNGEDGGQTVGHLHMHILGGRQLAWPPG